MTWILVLMMSSARIDVPVTTATVPAFATEQACKRAGGMIQGEFQSGFRYVCVPTDMVHTLGEGIAGVACAMVRTDDGKTAFYENNNGRPGQLLTADKLWVCRKSEAAR